uniref:Potassium channel domain-containing protein n=1 Tax=Panagrolaimus sp. ES5 TaxID=591445 RepID=A0AC34FXW3_9BILA
MKHVSFQESNIIPDNESMIETIDRESLDQQIILSSSLSPTTIKNNGNNVDSENPYDEVDEEDDEEEDDEDYDDEEEEEEEEEDSTHKNAASLFICFVLYLIIGSVIIASYEPEMDVFKAIYYTFVSLTTIGLGDVVPKSESYLAFTLIYIAIGLALTTIAIEIASDYLKKLHYFGRKMENVGNVQIWLTMNQLVKNLGDQFNLPVDELQNLNLDEFVGNAIKVEEGELQSLRHPDWPYGIKPIFITDFKDAFRDGSVIYADEDERYIIYSYAKGAYEKIIPRCLPATLKPPSPIRSAKK